MEPMTTKRTCRMPACSYEVKAGEKYCESCIYEKKRVLTEAMKTFPDSDVPKTAKKN